MAKTITGFLVNAAAKTITPVTLPFATGPQCVRIRELVGCRYFECVRLPDGNTAWVDEEGRLHGPEHFVAIRGGYPDPLAGNVLFLGPADREGDTLSCTLTLDFLKTRVFCRTIGEQNWHPVIDPAMETRQ